MNLEDLVAKYVALRDRKAALEAAHKEKLAPLNSAMDKVEGLLLRALNDIGGEAASIKTASGTAYITHRTSAKVRDWEGFFEGYVVPNAAWHMVNRACNKTAVAEFIEEYQTPPPGIEWVREAAVNINRPRTR